jgi:hypothetical protein
MKRSAYLLIGFMAGFLMGLSRSPAFAADIPDVHSLFYIRQSVSFYDFVLLLFIVIFCMVLYGAVNAMFSLISNGTRVADMESFLVEKLNPPKEPGSFIPVGSSLLTACSAGRIIIEGKPVERRGVWFVRHSGGNGSAGVVYDVIRQVVTNWKKPALYWGRSEQGILSGIMESMKPGREDLRRIAEILSGGLLLSPSPEPDPDILAGNLKKSYSSAGACALILEDPGNGFLRNYFSDEGKSRKLMEVSKAFHLPVFIITDDEQLNENILL